MPPAAGRYCRFSPDGNYLVIHHSSGGASLYKRDGDTFTRITTGFANDYLNPNATNAVAPTMTEGLAFSPDGAYIVMMSSQTKYVYLFRHIDGVFTKIAHGVTFTNTQYRAAFTPGSTHLIIVGADSSSILCTFLKRSGDTFSKITAPGNPTGTTVPYAVDLSPDGSMLTAGGTQSPFIWAYSLSGDTLTKLANLTALPGAPTDIRYSPDGKYVAAAHGGTPFVTIFRADVFPYIKLPNPAKLPPATAHVVAFV